MRFWKNHHLLDLTERPVWRVVKGRSRAYVEAAVSELTDVRTSSRVSSVRRLPRGGVEVAVEGLPPERFDHVVMATHSDVTLKILGGGARPDEAVRPCGRPVAMHCCHGPALAVAPPLPSSQRAATRRTATGHATAVRCAP